MLCDHVIPKPASMDRYKVHQVLEGLTGGERALFVDMGDHVVVRSCRNITEAGVPVRNVAEGDIVGFELRASCGRKNKGRHKYFDTGDWRSRHAWLEQRAGVSGFEVLSVNVSAQRVPVQKGCKRIYIDRSDFSGILKVTDTVKFLETLKNGVSGPAKAFGHGMLII